MIGARNGGLLGAAMLSMSFAPFVIQASPPEPLLPTFLRDHGKQNAWTKRSAPYRRRPADPAKKAQRKRQNRARAVSKSR